MNSAALSHDPHEAKGRAKKEEPEEARNQQEVKEDVGCKML